MQNKKKNAKQKRVALAGSSGVYLTKSMMVLHAVVVLLSVQGPGILKLRDPKCRKERKTEGVRHLAPVKVLKSRNAF